MSKIYGVLSFYYTIYCRNCYICLHNLSNYVTLVPGVFRRIMVTLFPLKSGKFLHGDWHFAGIMLNSLHSKGIEEDTPAGRTAQRGAGWWKALLVPLWDTTSEPSVGNGRSGAPVKASMSGFARSNQGGTVEYFVSHPWFCSGGGYFLYLLPI